MKNRIHPIAVALVGWYLMLPPATGQQGLPRLMVNAPIAVWTIAESFDTSKACEKELDVRRDRKSTRLNSSHRSLSRMPSSA